MTYVSLPWCRRTSWIFLTISLNRRCRASAFRLSNEWPVCAPFKRCFMVVNALNKRWKGTGTGGWWVRGSPGQHGWVVGLLVTNLGLRCCSPVSPPTRSTLTAISLNGHFYAHSCRENSDPCTWSRHFLLSSKMRCWLWVKKGNYNRPFADPYFPRLFQDVVLEDLLDDWILEIALGVHRDVKRSVSLCQLCHTK